MSTEKPSYRLKWYTRMSDVDRTAWNALAEPLPTPLLEWDWLDILEASGSICPETGWHPRHLTVWRCDRLVAAAPFYIKTHSVGEFVFDHVWAEAAGRLGVPYYPKLVGMSPLTPIEAYRFLVAPDQDASALTRMMLDEVDRLCRTVGLASCNFLWVDPEWADGLISHGFHQWQHPSFVMEKEGLSGFDGYLGLFRSGQRRNIIKERQRLDARGIRVVPFHGPAIPGEWFSRMHDFYVDTNDKFGPWGCRYLTPVFFDLLNERFRHRLLIMAGFDTPGSQMPMAMSLLLHKGPRLMGRYWGAARSEPYLHFEACYYGPLAWGLPRGVTRFDPGMGGDHKVRRGFAARPHYSMHRFFDARMRMLMDYHMDAVNEWADDTIAEINQRLPFQRSSSPRMPSGMSGTVSPPIT